MAVVKLVLGGEDGAEELDGRYVQVAVRRAQHAQGSGDDVVAHDEVFHAVGVAVHAQAEDLEEDAAGGGDGRVGLDAPAHAHGGGGGGIGGGIGGGVGGGSGRAPGGG